jgi:enolase
MYSSHCLLCREALADLYRKLLLKYPIMLLEDPFEQESFGEFMKFTSSVDCQVSVSIFDAMVVAAMNVLQKAMWL